MARIKNLSRFKRTISLPTVETSNIKRTRINPSVKIARKVREEADVINRMLEALERAGYSGEYASKTLFRKLDTPQISVIKNNRVNTSGISKNMTVTNLTYIKKALNDFKFSKTATPKGVLKREQQSRDYVAEQTGNIEFAESLSKEELSSIYEVFNDVDYKYLDEQGVISSDYIFTAITEAKEKNYGVRQFMRIINEHMEESPDLEERRSFRNIYNKYVKYAS